MKNIKITFILLCAGASLASAQQVPDSINKRFKATNPTVTDVQWQTDDNSYKATYHDQQNVEHVVTYDKAGVKETPVAPNGKSSTPIPKDSRGIQPTSGSKSLKGTNNTVPPKRTGSSTQNNTKSKSGTKRAGTDNTKAPKNTEAVSNKKAIPHTTKTVTTTTPNSTSPTNTHNMNTIPPKF